MIDKHPLMVALGLRMAKDRKERSEEIAAKIECATSTYRLAESGTQIPNPVLALKIAQVFGYEYSALTMLLVALLTTASAKTIGEMKNKLETIADAESDDRLKELYSNLSDEFWKYANGDIDKFKKYINDNIVDTILDDYLKLPGFGKSAARKTDEMRTDIANMFLSDLPTLYYDHLENSMNQLKELPVRIRFSDLFKWEENNKTLFTTLNSVIRNEDAIIHEDNLKLYKYDYLWEDSFSKARFIFLKKSKKDNRNHQKLFIESMKKALIQTGSEQIKKLDKISQKIEFKYAEPENEDVKNILLGKDYDNRVSGHQSMDYDGFWFFERRAKISVSFLATLSPHRTISDYLVFGEGYSLSAEESNEKISLFDKIWKESK